MRKIFGIFKKRWFITLLGMLALAALIWFVGPLFAFAGYEPLASVISRVVLIAIAFSIWLTVRVYGFLMARRKNRELMEEVAAPPDPAVVPESGPSESEEEVGALRERLEEALAALKKAKLGNGGGRQYLYQLPWYIIIGPPGAGKTTALVNSGLRFPLAERFGADAIRGVGGTRNCDWWFTDEAVLLDTAGRYTTQDSHQAVDSAAWTGFLRLLKKYRRRRPINGALVAISVSDLMQLDEAGRALHAGALRQRIQELHEHLGLRFPIYVLLTKCDLLAGFTEFFDDLGREERAQVWGMTFSAEDDAAIQDVQSHFGAEFDALSGRLDARLVDRLQRERDPGKRALIYGFPQQFVALKDAAARLLADVFQPSRYEEQPLLRGVYFTSGTQEGSPIDRLMGSLAANFGLQGEALPSAPGTGRSYFITRLFQDLIFGEAGLAGTNLRLERRRAWIQRGAYVGTLVAMIAAGAAWFTSFARNQSYVGTVAEQADGADTLVKELPIERRETLAALAPLNAVSDIRTGYREREESAPMLMRLGLYQGDKLGPEARSAYRRVLHNVFLPRLVLRIEDQLQQGGGSSDFLYEGLKVYLMLDDPEHFNGEEVGAWIKVDWERNLPREATVEQRAQLREHLDALLQDWPSPLPVPLDGNLVTRVRNTLTRVPLAERLYGRLKRDQSVAGLPPFSVAKAAGRDAAQVFVRKSGQPLNTGISGLYTYGGYHGFFLTQSLGESKRLSEETWVLGDTEQQAPGEQGSAALGAEVRRLYLEDYTREWDGLLADLDIAPFTSLQQSVDLLNILSGPGSPVRSLLAAVERETTLERLPDGLGSIAKGAGQTAGKLSNATGIGSGMKSRLERLLGAAPESTGAAGPAAKKDNLVETHFEPLNRQVRTADNVPAPLDRTLSMLNELYVHMNSIAAMASRGEIIEGAREQAGSIITKIELDAKRQPTPLNRWLDGLAQSSTTLTLGGIQENLNTAWNATVAPFCQRAISNRYPVDRGSSQEITLEDFGKFFGPGGIVDEYFKRFLEPFVDTATEPWRVRASGNVALELSQDTLITFQRAAVIRDTFFRAGSPLPSVRFDLTPATMDAEIDNFLLDLEGQRITYSHGPVRPSPLKWPEPAGPRQVRILLSPPAPSGVSGLTEDGTWAWFRVLDRSTITPLGTPERFSVTFDVGGRRATFEVRAGSAYNPFDLPELQSFRCPKQL